MYVLLVAVHNASVNIRELYSFTIGSKNRSSKIFMVQRKTKKKQQVVEEKRIEVLLQILIIGNFFIWS